jgi:hypothetical protein
MNGVEVDLVRLSLRHCCPFSGGGTLFHGELMRRSMLSRMSFKIARRLIRSKTNDAEVELYSSQPKRSRLDGDALESNVVKKAPEGALGFSGQAWSDHYLGDR